MRMGKRAATVCALIVGATLLATSALADVMIGSGYQTLKDTLKTTAAALTGEVDSFTLEMTSDVKFDGESLNYQNSTTKVDAKSNQMESTTNYADKKRGSYENYFYAESGRTVNKYSDDETYFVTERNDMDMVGSRISNPFEEEMAADMEKIVDAMVGNLKDVVQVEESDGKKMFVGNISEAQVPTLVNAVLSFGVKYSIADSYTASEYGVPALVSDIYVTEASGKAIANADGILENVVGTGTITGKDEAGASHTLTVELAATVTDINHTAVQAPDLEGKTVEYVKAGESSNSFGQQYVGTYKGNIVRQTGETLEKIGERVMEITAVDGTTVTGRYYEVYNDGAAPEEGALDFAFTGQTTGGGYAFDCSYQNVAGESKTMRVQHEGNVEGEEIGVTTDIILNPDNGGYTMMGEYFTLFRVFE